MCDVYDVTQINGGAGEKHFHPAPAETSWEL